MTEPQAEIRDAFTLLSKPTLELTDKEVDAICADLRKRRERFLAGQKDNPPKAVKAEPPKTTEEKQAVGESILGDVANLF